MAKPFHNAIMGMKENMTHMRDSFQLIEDVLEPIIEEVENSDENFTKMKRLNHPTDQLVHDTKYYQKTYLNKLEKRCNEQLIRGAQNCQNAFQDSYTKCYDKLPSIVNYLLCWPMKIDYVCNIAEVGDFDFPIL